MGVLMLWGFELDIADDTSEVLEQENEANSEPVPVAPEWLAPPLRRFVQALLDTRLWTVSEDAGVSPGTRGQRLVLVADESAADVTCLQVYHSYRDDWCLMLTRMQARKRDVRLFAEPHVMPRVAVETFAERAKVEIACRRLTTPAARAILDAAAGGEHG